jgi:hypothetical protein
MIIPKEKLADENEVVQSTPKGKERAARLNATSEALPTLPVAPTLAPVLGIKADTDLNVVSYTCPVDGGTKIVRKALEAIPIGSTIVFATDDLGVLFLADALIVRGTGAYGKVEHLAQACNCSFSLRERYPARSHSAGASGLHVIGVSAVYSPDGSRQRPSDPAYSRTGSRCTISPRPGRGLWLGLGFS